MFTLTIVLYVNPEPLKVYGHTDFVLIISHCKGINNSHYFFWVNMHRSFSCKLQVPLSLKHFYIKACSMQTHDITFPYGLVILLL